MKKRRDGFILRICTS